jgi:hypothetical protein
MESHVKSMVSTDFFTVLTIGFRYLMSPCIALRGK